jgi:hypothetical protein
MRKFFVNESFARFVDDFSDEQKISQFIEDINMQVQIDKIKTTAGLLNYCESQQSWWFKNFGIWSWWNLSFILIIPFFIKIVTYFAGPSSIPQQFFDKIISEIKNGINPADYKTSAEFLARVKFIYPEYRNANFPPGTQEADALVNRRIHTDKVITMHHAFVSGNFREIYDYLSPREKAKITFEEYTDFLNIAKAKYDALPLETKKALQEATIFHDYGYKYAAKMNDHGYEGAVRVAEILRGLPNRSLEYIERLKFIILRHGDYGDIEAGGVLPKDILALNQTQQDLLFLVGMFDNMGKPPNYGGNSMTQQMINNYLTLIDRLKEYVKKNEFYKARFDNLLSPANFVGAIPVSIKQKLKDKVEKLVPADKKEAFHHVWNDRIRLDNYAIFSDMYKLRGYDPALIEERCAKLVVIIGEIVMKLDVDIRFDTDINYMLTMDHGTLFQRGIYLEALFDYLDNDRKIPYHLEEVGGQTKVILDLNEMVKKRHLVKRAAKFLVVVNIPAVFLKEITKIAKTLKADSAADFTGMNSDNIQAMLKAV